MPGLFQSQVEKSTIGDAAVVWLMSGPILLHRDDVTGSGLVC